MKKLSNITLLTTFLVALGMPSFAALDSGEASSPPKSLVRSPFPSEDPFANETDTDSSIVLQAPFVKSPGIPPETPVKLSIPAAPTPRTQNTVKRVATDLAEDIGLSPPSPTASIRRLSTQEVSEGPSTTSVPAPAKSPSLKSTKLVPSAASVDAVSEDSSVLVPKSGLFSCFSCRKTRSTPTTKGRSPFPLAQDTESDQLATIKTTTGVATNALAEESEQTPPASTKPGYESVSADPEGDASLEVLDATTSNAPCQETNPLPETVSTTMNEGGATLEEPSATDSPEAIAAGETAPAETHFPTAAIPEPHAVSSESQPEASDEAIISVPAKAQSASDVVAKSKKKRFSWLRSCWPKTKKSAAVIEQVIENVFVDVAPYIEDGLKLVAASTPNPAIQGVINFLAILIKEASAAVTKDGATFDLTTKSGQKVRVASPHLLHANNFANNGNLSEESKMVISVILARAALVPNYGDLIGFINMVVAQDNNSPETIRFDAVSGNISLYPNDIGTQFALLSIPILDSLSKSCDRVTTSNILLEYVAATEDRSSTEKILDRRLGSNFLPTPQSWVRTAFQELVEQNSPFVLDPTLNIERGVADAIREEVVARETVLKAKSEDTVRRPLSRT